MAKVLLAPLQHVRYPHAANYRPPRHSAVEILLFRGSGSNAKLFQCERGRIRIKGQDPYQRGGVKRALCPPSFGYQGIDFRQIVLPGTVRREPFLAIKAPGKMSALKCLAKM